MAHLIVQGVPVECSASVYSPVPLGEISRSCNGQPRSSVRVRKRGHRFTTDTGGLLLEEADRLRQLLEGEGHSWNFESSELYSSRHLLPSSVSGGITSGDAGGYHSLGLYAPAGSSITWPVAVPTTSYTVLFWRVEAGPEWFHYALVKNGSAPLAVWKNENSGATNPNIISINGSGSLVLTATADETIDELAVLPYAAPDAWVLAFFDWRTSFAWDPLPYVRATGAGVNATSVGHAGYVVLGECGEGVRVPLRDSNGAFTTGEVFDFTLHST